MVPTQGELLSTEGEVLSTEGDVLPTEGEVLSTEGDVLSIEGEVLSTEGQVLPTAGVITGQLQQGILHHLQCREPPQDKTHAWCGCQTRPHVTAHRESGCCHRQ